MAAKPSTDAEKALQKIQEQVTCGICHELYKQPKMLKCLHAFCEHCLQPLAQREEYRGLQCPMCRQVTPLPYNGVSGLQAGFFHESLLESYDLMKCPNDSCSKHPGKEADFYCETCTQLICSICFVPDHRDHQYDLVDNVFAKHEKEIVDSLKPVKEQIAVLKRAVESVDTRCAAVEEHKTAVVAKIHSVMAVLRRILEVREKELVGQAEQTAQEKRKTLEAQRDGFEQQLGRLSSCHDSVEESLRTCSQGKILGMKKSLTKQIDDLTGSFKPEALALAEQADMRFTHSLPELAKTCQQFGKVYCHPVCPEKCRALGEGIEEATRGQTATVTVEVLDREGEAYLKPVDSLSCELVGSYGSRVSGTVSRGYRNIYNISYPTWVEGKHQLHILVDEHPILNSPFTVIILPDLTAPVNIIEDLEGPWGIAVGEGGEVVVSEFDGHCVSVISEYGEKELLGTRGSAYDQVNSPEGVAIDAGGKVFVADSRNHRIKQLSSTTVYDRREERVGTASEQFNSPEGVTIGADSPDQSSTTVYDWCEESVGTCGSGRLQFQLPVSVTVHPQTNKVYVADCYNHRIQVLNSDLTYSSSFGREGSNNGEFNCPYDLATDSDGNVYVADSLNHRIQVFTADGVYLRQFGKEGEGEGELKEPVSIAISSHNVVYVGELGNNRVSIFSTDGEFIKSFGRPGEGDVQFDGPYGLAVDKKGSVYVCDTYNHRIQIFT